MKKLFLGTIILTMALNSCGDYGDYGDEGSSIDSPIILSSSEHHVGDDEGAEGVTLSAEFEMPSSFSAGELEITFVYPDVAGTSGPDVDDPPVIKINGVKVGVESSDFLQYGQCVSEYRQFECTRTFTYYITSALQAGTNEFTISSAATYDGGRRDDFSFSDVVIRFDK